MYKEYTNGVVSLIRNTNKIKDAHGVVAIVENRVLGNDEFEASLTRYQYTNLISSVSIETDDEINANIITYEEYYPFGNTSFCTKQDN